MSEQSPKQYYLSLVHRVESVNHKPLTINVLIAQDTPNLTSSTLNQAAGSAVRNAEDIMPGIEVIQANLIARIDLGYMSAEEFSPEAAAETE